MLPCARRAEEPGFEQIRGEDIGRRGGTAQAATVLTTTVLTATTHITAGIGTLPARARNVCFTAREVEDRSEGGGSRVPCTGRP
ncbi:hypothetical protein [Streptomyces sp. NPDC003401]